MEWVRGFVLKLLPWWQLFYISMETYSGPRRLKCQSQFAGFGGSTILKEL